MGVGTHGVSMVWEGCGELGESGGSLSLHAPFDLLVALGRCVALSGLLSSWVRQER